jgi:hypothetical protein
MTGFATFTPFASSARPLAWGPPWAVPTEDAVAGLCSAAPWPLFAHAPSPGPGDDQEDDDDDDDIGRGGGSGGNIDPDDEDVDDDDEEDDDEDPLWAARTVDPRRAPCAAHQSSIN